MNDPTNWNTVDFGTLTFINAEEAKKAEGLFNQLRQVLYITGLERDAKDRQLASCYDRMEKAEKRLLQLTGQSELEIIAEQQARITALERVLVIVERNLPRNVCYIDESGTPLRALVKGVL